MSFHFYSTSNVTQARTDIANTNSNLISSRLSCVNSKVRLFADDCLLYREIKNNQDQIDMQRDLDALMDWGSTWGMKFNAKKCNINHYAGLAFSQTSAAFLQFRQ